MRMAMYIETVPGRDSPPAMSLRAACDREVTGLRLCSGLTPRT